MIFENCLIKAPDDVNLSRCGEKKAMWYVKNGLAEIVGHDPLTIKLLFEPSGRNGINDPLLMSGKPNICVVCGTPDNLTRHHIIPYAFIKHMSVECKVDIIRDIMPLCEHCHGEYEKHSNIKRQELAEFFGVQLHGLSICDYRKIRRVKAAASALIKYDGQIPQRRREELLDIVRDFFDKSDITDHDLKMAESLEPESIPGHVDVMKRIADTVYDYTEFAKDWRKHFVETMRPKYMPEAWTVDRVTDPSAIWVPLRMRKQ